MIDPVTRPMKVLHINSYYSTRDFYYNLFEEQVKQQMAIDVYVPVAFEPKLKLVKNSYTRVVINHNKFDRLVFHLKHHKILNDVVKQYDISQYDVLHAHSLFSNGYIAWRLKQQYSIPYIVAVRSSDVNTFFGKMLHLRQLGIKILNDADAVIFLSESYRQLVLDKYVPQQLRALIFSKSHVIPNGIDKFWFDNLAQPKKITSQQPIRLLHVGLINRNKNLLTTLKAVEELSRAGYQVTYSVVGKVEDQGVFKELMKNPAVNYLGTKSRSELLPIYRSCDIFVLPSVNETFGLVYAEALSQGLPVIYSQGQGFDLQFPQGVVGYSVPCFGDQAIAEALLEIMNHYEELSVNCIELVNKFNWTLIAQEYQRIYLNL